MNIFLTEGNMPTRDEQKAQRRQLILFTALELFVKKGYADTKIGDIAAAANMSAGLMFHYFDSKEQLCEELVKIGAQGASNAPKELAFGSPLDYFSGFLKELFSYAEKQPWVFYMFVFMSQVRRSAGIPVHIKEIAMSVDQIEQSAEIIRAGQVDGTFRNGDPYSLAFTFWSSVQGVMEELSAELPNINTKPETDWLIDIIRGVK